MPEQYVHHQIETDADQQTITIRKTKGANYENDRQSRSGRIQCRN